MNRQVPWLRVFVEGVVIVESILMAFGIEAWWDGQQLRRDEAQALGDLHTEFAANLDGIERITRRHRTLISAGTQLLAMTRDRDATPPRPQLDTLLFASFVDYTTYDPQSAALSDLMSSGRLGLISDDTLRMALADWPAAVEDFIEEERLVVRLVESSLLPYVTARAATVDLYRASREAYGSFAPGQRDSDLAALLGAPEFESHVANRVAHESRALYELEIILRPKVDMILERLVRATR